MRTVDYIILILTGVVSVSLVVAISAPIILDTQLSEAKAQLVAGLLSSMLTIINMYVGYFVGRNEGKKKEPRKD